MCPRIAYHNVPASHPTISSTGTTHSACILAGLFTAVAVTLALASQHLCVGARIFLQDPEELADVVAGCSLHLVLAPLQFLDSIQRWISQRLWSRAEACEMRLTRMHALSMHNSNRPYNNNNHHNHSIQQPPQTTATHTHLNSRLQKRKFQKNRRSKLLRAFRRCQIT